MRRHASLLLLALVGCTDGPLDPNQRSDEISDAVHGGGNPHFYLKAPMVPSVEYGGEFDPTLAPTVVICEWDGTACVGEPIATFSAEEGKGSEAIRVEPADEQYIVNWHTGRYPVEESKIYRIRFLVGSYQLGFADVDFVKNAREAKNVNTGQFIALRDGTTLPIKFRIEEGALPSGADRPIAAGVLHSCGIVEGGAAYCWGYNNAGQLGDGTQTNSSSPVAVSGGYSFSEIVTGYAHTCGLDNSGAAYCWGNNAEGAVGSGQASLRYTTPVPVDGGHTFTQISAGHWHTCALTADGSLWCWGSDKSGQLGDGTLNGGYAYSPQQVSGGPYQQVDAGYNSTCAVTTGGVAKCWGENGYQQLGFASPSKVVVPTDVSGGHTFSEVQVGFVASCGQRVDGETLCWGYNAYGTLGQGTVNYIRSGPLVVTGGHAFGQVDVGGMHACGVLEDGTAYCWGSNGMGQLGIESTTARTGTPTAVAGTDKWSFISTGMATTCGVTTTGAGKCWGWNSYGQAGTGSTSFKVASPADVTGGHTFDS